MENGVEMENGEDMENWVDMENCVEMENGVLNKNYSLHVLQIEMHQYILNQNANY
jgi:hypothetical protein